MDTMVTCAHAPDVPQGRIGRPEKEHSLDTAKTSSLKKIRAALQGCYASMEALCADLSDAEWGARSLCPDWTVRDVVNHVTSIEAVMTGWLPEDDRTPPPFERAGDFLRETDASHVDDASYIEKVRAVYDPRRRDLAAPPTPDPQRPP